MVGRGILLGADDVQIADQCARLLNDPGLCESLGVAGGEMVAMKYSFAAFLSAVRKGISAVDGPNASPH